MSTILLQSTLSDTLESTSDESGSAMTESIASSTESSASPLSKANDNYEINFDTPQTQPTLNECKHKLQSLNALLSPMQLFDKFDSMIKNYTKLKQKYAKQWKLQQSYRQKLRSIIKETQYKYTLSMSDISLNQIDSFIQTVQNIQFSVIHLFKNCQMLQLPHIATLQTNKSISTPSSYQLSKVHKPKNPNENKIRSFDHRQSKEESEEYPNVSKRSLKSYRRRSSVRSFGTLYSDQFRNSVALTYKKSISINDDFKLNHSTANEKEKIINYYRSDCIGQNELFESPFGVRPVIYCDWTASGKPLNCVETYINQTILPFYANTHTSTSITGIQTSKFRSESRSIILESLGGDHTKDAVIFTGSGATAAIYKLSQVLMKCYKPSQTVVFISVYEHNSNIFIWKELGSKVIVIPENKSDRNEGGIDLNLLENKLKFYSSKRMKSRYSLLIGSFCAVSNVSGIIAPIEKTTLLLHKYKALSFWDYATAAPYMDINMSNERNPLLSKDAVFISGHKFMGGPGSCGILCAKKKLFCNYVPVVPGGGTVFMAYGVKEGEFEYLQNIEEREEGGTPNIIGSIRTSFAFMIKDHISTQWIAQREKEYLEYFMNECKNIKNFVLLGNTKCKRVPIISFLITHSMYGSTKYLHFNFIAALMNDLFGIQGRGGCACAGMYGKYVLHISDRQIETVLSQIKGKNQNELVRPGFFRLNLHFTLNREELEYITNAVKFVCKNGWLFLPLYDFDAKSGNYFYNNYETELKSLLDVRFSENGIKMNNKALKIRNNDRSFFNGRNLNKYLVNAQNEIISNLKQYLSSNMEVSNDKSEKNKSCHKNAWYWLPNELYRSVINFTSSFY